MRVNYHRRGEKLPSDIIDIGKLERDNRKTFWLGMLVSVLLHGLLAAYIIVFRPMIDVEKYERPPVRSIPVDIVEIPPRPRDRFELPGRVPRERVIPRRRRSEIMPDRIVETRRPEQFRGPYEFYDARPDSLIRKYVTPQIEGDASLEIKRFVDPEFYIPERFLTDMTIKREPVPPSSRISLRDELISIEDLDYGKYMGVAVLDDYDEKKIRGFIHLPLTITGVELEQPDMVDRAMEGLADALRMYTGLEPTLDDMITLTDPGIQHYPFLYIAVEEEFTITNQERRNLRKFLVNGGFLFVEAYGFPDGMKHFVPRGAASAKQMITDAVGSWGSLGIIPNDHMLYHSFFDFDEGPPRITRLLQAEQAQPASVLEGVFIEDRLAVVYSEKEYGANLADVNASDAYRKIGVNMIVLTLVQKGGSSLKILGEGAYTR